MLAYRITRTKYARSLFPPKSNNRWNSSAHAVLYAASHRSLAYLETLVHRSGEMMMDDFSCITLEIPDSCEVHTISLQELPDGWRWQNSLICRQMGDQWIQSYKTLCLRVPSAMVQEEYNLVLNIAHAEFDLVNIVDVSPFQFDPRLEWKARDRRID